MLQKRAKTLTLAAAALSAGLAAGLALAGTAAVAAPGAVGGLKADANKVSPVEATSYSCWWRHGVRYCRRTAPALGFYFGPQRRYGHYGYRRWY